MASAEDHWLGGKGGYGKANCPVCQNPLLLLLDLNCEDPILRKASRGKFGVLKRMPLYICARCFCQLSYGIDEHQNVRVIHTKYGDPENEPLYEGYPDYFPRRTIALDAVVPPALPKVIRKWNPDVDLRGVRLSKSERRLLEDFFGHPIFIPRFMYHHQLGGESLYESWDETASFCPNPKCSAGLFNKILQRGRPMRFFAGILNDPPGGFPLIEPLNDKTRKNWNYFVSFHFQICEKCLTITASSTSD